MRQQILYVKNASDIILIFLKHGNTTIIVLNNAIQNFYKITLYIKIYYILTAGHHLFCRFIAKSDNAFQHALLILNGIFISQDRKSTRLNSSHANISYAVFCL